MGRRLMSKYKYGWNKVTGKLRFFAEQPYAEIDILRHRGGYFVFYNNLGVHKKPLSLADAKKKALVVMKKHKRKRR